MAHCNSCGKYVAPTDNIYKRQLYNGQTNSTYYGKRVSFGTRKHYSMKSVCMECAVQIDEQVAKSNRMTVGIFLVIGIIVLLYILSK